LPAYVNAAYARDNRKSRHSQIIAPAKAQMQIAIRTEGVTWRLGSEKQVRRREIMVRESIGLAALALV
jgi:hypothetical protein